jgi:hypothetical protein
MDALEKNMRNLVSNEEGKASDITWTAGTVREYLPDVRIQVVSRDGKPVILDAMVQGRKENFAHVRPFYGSVASDTEWLFAWETIADALNNNRILICGRVYE